MGYSPLQFEVGNHDDIFKIVELMRSRGNLKESDVTAFALGLKLFSEVMLENKENPLLPSFKNDFGNL